MLSPRLSYSQSWFNQTEEATQNTTSSSSSPPPPTTSSSTYKPPHYDASGSPPSPTSPPSSSSSSSSSSTIKKARDYGTKRVCYAELYLPPHPYFPWFWNTWYQEIPCVRGIASPLYQVTRTRTRTRPFKPTPTL